MNRVIFICLLIIALFCMGCDRDTDGSSTTFLDNGPEGTPVTGLPGPTPFTPSPSAADLSITTADLNITPGTTHVFSVDIIGIAGSGSLASTNIIAISSGTVFGLPVSITFSDPVFLSPGIFRSTGTFSGSLDGVGTVNASIFYSEENLTIAETFVFVIAGIIPPENCTNGVDDDGDGLIDLTDPDCVPSAEVCSDGIDNDFDGLIDCADSDCDGDIVNCPTETIFYHDGSAETGLSCTSAASSMYLVHFAAVLLTPPFDLTEIIYDIDSTGSSGAVMMDVVVYAVTGTGGVGAEIGRVVGVAASTPAGTYTVTIPPGAITITTTEFFAGVETAASETAGVFIGRDTDAPIVGPGIGSSFISSPDCGITPAMDLTDVGILFGDPGLDGDWLITVTISS